MSILTQRNVFLITLLFVLNWQAVDVCQLNAQTQQRHQLTEQELKLRDKLEKDSTFKVVSCSVILTKENLEGKALEARQFSNRIKLLLFEAAQSSNPKETVKVKKICSTREGDQIPSYLTVNQGKVTLVVDTSRDKFGSGQIHLKDCENLTLGNYVWINSGYEFQPIQNNDKSKITDKATLVLRCESKQKDESFFVKF